MTLSTKPAAAVSTGAHRKWLWVGGTILGTGLAGLAVALLWDWNWLRPVVEARLSAAIGRPVTMERLEVVPGRLTLISGYNVRIASPQGFQGPEFASVPRLSVTFDAATWWHTSRIVLPMIEADQPNFNVVRDAAGQSNWVAAFPLPTAGDPTKSPAMEIGDVHIKEGVAHVLMADDNSDLTMSISTENDAKGGSLTIKGKGVYARQAITFQANGGALLTLRDTKTPYPVDLALANGGTRITLKGSVRDPLALAGADLNLVLSGPDMALLFPLTGIATPNTPPYQVSGRLDFDNGLIKFTNMIGRVGSSDLNGELDVDRRGSRPILSGALTSRQVDMDDLGGFIGATPGRETTPGQTPAQVEAMRRAKESPKLLPTKTISLPKVRAADVHITYRGTKILGKNVPFDSIQAKLDIDDGHIRLSPLRVGIGRGAISGSVDLMPIDNEVNADADVTLEHVDVGKLLASAGFGSGQGSIDGTAKLKGRGASLSSILAHGDGEFHAVMPAGGDINSLLVDLLGLEVGRAFFAAIGIPDKEAVRCMVADFTLQKGILASRTMEVNTTEHVISGGGRVDLAREVLELSLRTDPKHFTIGTLATPILISGSFKDLHFAPDPALAVRGGVAIGLGLLFPPAALLPTIQFGVNENSPCAEPGKPRTTR